MTWSGVGKSKSPDDNSMTSRPSARSSRARRRNTEAGEASIRLVRGERNSALSLGFGILRHPVAERPVLGRYLHQVDEDVLRTKARIRGQALDDPAVKRLLLRRRPRIADRELDDHEIVAARDPEIRRAVGEVVVVMLGDGHEAIVVRHIEGLAQRVINAIENGLAIGSGLAPPQGNTCERHGLVSLAIRG